MKSRNKKHCDKCNKDIDISNFKRHYEACKGIIENQLLLQKEWRQENGRYKCPYCQKEYVKKGICTHIYINHIAGSKHKSGFIKYNDDIKKGIRHHSFRGKHLSEEHRKNLSIAFNNKIKEGWIPPYVTYIKSDNGKVEQSKRKIKLYDEHPEKHPNRKLANNRKKMSYPEKICYDWLTNNKIEFEHQKHIGKYWVDFFIIDKNLVIEVDGDYWHKEENIERQQFIEKDYKIQRIKAKENIEQRLKQIFA